MFDRLQRFVPLLAGAIFPLIFALTVASLGKQSGFPDLLVFGLAAVVAVIVYFGMRLGRSQTERKAASCHDGACSSGLR
jgi:hypothetical protein